MDNTKSCIPTGTFRIVIGVNPSNSPSRLTFAPLGVDITIIFPVSLVSFPPSSNNDIGESSSIGEGVAIEGVDLEPPDELPLEEDELLLEVELLSVDIAISSFATSTGAT